MSTIAIIKRSCNFNECHSDYDDEIDKHYADIDTYGSPIIKFIYKTEKTLDELETGGNGLINLIYWGEKNGDHLFDLHAQEEIPIEQIKSIIDNHIIQKHGGTYYFSDDY